MDSHDVAELGRLSNPTYANALLPMLNAKVKEYDTKYFPNGNPASSYPDAGGAELTSSPTEELAALFAFAAQISPDSAQRDDYAARARKMLMYVMTEAAKGASASAPFRDPPLLRKDRARWSGELWPLIVDWIYGYLSDADKATIRTVFVRWGKNRSLRSTPHDRSGCRTTRRCSPTSSACARQ